jgi:N-acetylglucosamine kinase-like BadF-type ATPase
VQRAAESGDAVAREILSGAGAELSTAAASVIRRLDMRGDVFPTILAGGIFRGLPSLARDVESRLSEVAPRSEVRLLDVEPAIGAVRLALAAARGEVAIPAYV